jgi:hypothetical protein
VSGAWHLLLIRVPSLVPTTFKVFLFGGLHLDLTTLVSTPAFSWTYEYKKSGE